MTLLSTVNCTAARFCYCTLIWFVAAVQRQSAFVVLSSFAVFIRVFIRLDIQVLHLLIRLTTGHTTVASACCSALLLMIFIHVFILLLTMVLIQPCPSWPSPSRDLILSLFTFRRRPSPGVACYHQRRWMRWPSSRPAGGEVVTCCQ